MDEPAFLERDPKPDDLMLARALGKTKTWWDAILTLVEQPPAITIEWKFYGAKYGWQLKASRGKRAVVYLVPRTGHFTAGVALPESALDAVRTADLPAELVREITTAKPAPEGRPARVAVRDRATAAILKTLIAIKLDQRASTPRK